MDKKNWFIVIGSLIFITVFFVGINQYQEYQVRNSLEDEISEIEAEIAKLDAGDYSDIASESYTQNLSLSNFSANSDGTFVNAYGSITNNSSQSIDEIGEIAFFNSDGSINRVKSIMVKLDAGETLHFEELIGLTKDGTEVPSSAELTGF
ncbi:hypothetical protein [Psychrobacillus sp. FSL H8-0510]|uniref:hypothetical protein n=1 Tax=Psychrobacillus sp. FSL H8-0510 TaxID=2921394 RepID=UPI0030FCDDE0